MKELILIGGGGHCTACIDVIESQGKYKILGILDCPEKVGTNLLDYPILDTDDAIAMYVEQGCSFLVTVGQIKSSELRENLYTRLVELNAPLATVVSPRAHISRTAQIGKGVVVMHDALINAGAQVADNCIINTKSLVEHDAIVEAHCHISTGAIVNGGAQVSKGSFVGSNAVVVQGMCTEEQTFLPAGKCYVGHRNASVKLKTAVLTTIFPVNDEYIHDYFSSLNHQTVQGFDVVIVNDSFGDLSEIREHYSQLNIIELSPEGTIAKNREKLCQFALRNRYDVAIFADVDDYFSNNRFEQSINLLSHYDIVVNDLSSFNEKKEIKNNILSNRIYNGDEITLDFIRDKNVFGLSNTAIRLSGMRCDNFRFPNSLVAVDWYLFSILLLESKRAVFTNSAVTYYRQYQDNTVGMGKVTKESIKKSLIVRKVHYQNMLSISDSYQTELYDNDQLTSRFIESNECEEIIKMNQEYNDTLLWWEVITK